MTTEPNTPVPGLDLNKASQLSIEQMKAIYYVYLTGSMAEAGEMIGVCKFTVNRWIQEAEEILGVILFE